MSESEGRERNSRPSSLSSGWIPRQAESQNGEGKSKCFSWDEWNKDTLSFYFSCFPHDWGRVELWRVFARFGQVRDIFLPKKVNNKGRRFGFVRFKGVRNAKEMETSLGRVQFGAERMEVNISRFQKGVVGKIPLTPRIREGKDKGQLGKLRGNKSYAEVCKEQVQEKDRPTHVTKENKSRSIGSGRWLGREYNVKGDDMEWVRQCFVAVAKTRKEIDRLQEEIVLSGHSEVLVKPMGGNRVLLQPKGSEFRMNAQSIMKWAGEWFESVKPWSPSESMSHRYVWVRCVGVPIHVWNQEFFRYLTKGLGRFIRTDEPTRSKSRFDVGRVLVQTMLAGSINSLIKVKINGHVFSIGIKEESDLNYFSTDEWDGDWSQERTNHGRSEEAGIRSSQIPASDCDASGEEDEEASIGFQGDVMMGLQLESGGEEGSRGIGEESQDGSLEGEDEVSGEHAGVGKSERFFGPECKDGSSGPKLGLEELGRGKEGQENKMGQVRVESGYGLVNIDPVKGMEADENVNTSTKSGDGPDVPRIANGTEWAAWGGSDQGMYPGRKGQNNSGGDRGISRIKKARKMKKLILVQKDDFFGEMESEADRMVIAQESRRARKRVMTKKRRKPRLQAALESASEADKSQAETSRESNYFVDCRTKSGPAGVR